jgi:hypothetical protein
MKDGGVEVGGFEEAGEGIRPADHQAHGSSSYGHARRECILHHSAFILSAERARSLGQICGSVLTLCVGCDRVVFVLSRTDFMRIL